MKSLFYVKLISIHHAVSISLYLVQILSKKAILLTYKFPLLKGTLGWSVYTIICPCVVVFRRFVEFFGNSMDRIGHEHFLATVDFKPSYLVGPTTKFPVIALSVQNANEMFTVRSKYVILPTSPNRNGGEQVWFPSSIALLCKKCSKTLRLEPGPWMSKGNPTD